MAGVFALSIENSRYYQKILKINKQLKESNNTKDKFFNIIAHDLKSPFASILGFSEMLMEHRKTLENDKIEMFAKVIYDSSKQAYDLLGNLLMWAQSQKGNISFYPEAFCFNNIALENINLLEQQAIKKNLILFSTINDDLQVFADKNMMKTIVRNLLSNAIKFTPSGGKIIVEAIPSPDYVEIIITDTGIGIPENIINKLFRIDTNITTEGTEHEKGTGLGLILCKEFVEKHGGKIWAESIIKEGSTFHFTIPTKNH
jgi:signal transduction histidine kinase